jgi:hypothetical protein
MLPYETFRYSFIYWQSLSNFCNHQIVLSVTVRSSEKSNINDIWIFSFIYQDGINLIVLSSHQERSNCIYAGVSKSFRTGRLVQEIQIVQLSAIRCSCIAILRVNLVSFASITFCVASERMFIVVSMYFVIDSVRKFLDTPSYDCCDVGTLYSW